ncbi:hypothetical protein Aperf_G00000028693 [Anoplocephala perfoliata]
MANYIPSARKPLENLQQEMDYSRGRPLNPSSDIGLPVYVVENAIVSAISRDNAAYVKDILRKCPLNIERYVYSEVYTSEKPLRKNITVCPLLYHAIRKSALECIGVLLRCGASAFQPSYTLEWASLQEGELTIEIVEKPCVAWLAELIASNAIEFSARVLQIFKLSNIDFTTPVEFRIQRLKPSNPNPTKTIQYTDVWECIEKRIEKICPRDQLANLKATFKSLHSGFTMNNLETIYAKKKLVKPTKPPEEPKEQTSET